MNSESISPHDTTGRALEIATPWLGSSRGHLSDWVTQQWVRATGQRVEIDAHSIFDGLAGDPRGIGQDFFNRLALANDYDVDESSARRGLVADIGLLGGPDFDPDSIDDEVIDFYEDTANYELDVWSAWNAPWRPFGALLAIFFSRRLQQLNVPLAPLDSALGMTNRVLKLRRADGLEVLTAWVRTMRSSGNTLYAGSYGVCSAPGERSPCMRIVFPLPNGSAIVVMRPVANPDGSFTVTSHGERFGDAGFYFFVRDPDGGGWGRYLRSLQESIHVYAGEDRETRADHVLSLFGRPFLKLHYRMRRKP